MEENTTASSVKKALTEQKTRMIFPRVQSDTPKLEQTVMTAMISHPTTRKVATTLKKMTGRKTGVKIFPLICFTSVNWDGRRISSSSKLTRYLRPSQSRVHRVLRVEVLAGARPKLTV